MSDSPTARGLLHHRAGRLSEAQALYREALAQDPGNIDALHFLGVIAFQRGEHSEAVRLISRALTLDGANPAAYNNLGNALAAQGKTLDALSAYLEAVGLRPEDAEALSNLGGALRALGKTDKAIGFYRRALGVSPELRAAQVGLQQALAESSGRTEALPEAAQAAQAPLQLGVAHLAQGRTEEAVACLREALALWPESPEAHFNLGNAHRERAQLDDAIAGYRRALALAPDFPAAYVNLGSAFLEQGRLREARACFRKALALEPDLAEAHYNLGVAARQAGDLAAAKPALAAYLRLRPGDRAALLALGEACSRTNDLDEAARSFEQVLARDPGDAAAHNLLGNVRRNQARHPEALEHYAQAIRYDPDPVVAFQNLLFCMLCTGSHPPADIRDKHLEFARRFEQPLLAGRAPPANSLDPARRLRVGYVSPDFRVNVVGHYMQPILEHHDRAAFEVHCFSTGAGRDAVTERIASLAARWHDVQRLTDDAIADLVRAQGIDLLVDLCGHGPGNRILVFARKPAPVQVSYLDYSATTGLSSIDYRLTTEYCDPTGIADRYYSEELYRLGDAYWTYNPAVRLPVSPLPAASNRYVTFGSFNLYYRVTHEVLELWTRLLAAVPDSRLVIVSVAAGSTQAALLERFSRAGIARERVAVHGTVPYERYHALMGETDIALAPFPYNGATTVMDCLWNGLPVVAMAGGETFSSRLGCSVLVQAGLPELIAHDAEDYLRVAAELAGAPRKLAAMRQKLRPKLERSPLRDFAGFTRGLERAYRSMWRAWCATAAR